MCGIHASISTQRSQQPSDLLKQLLHNRGPDHTGEHFSRLHGNDDTSYWISLFSTVLALRGSCVTPQPFVHVSSGSALCWNGEAWKIGLEPVTGNDGEVVFELLVKACLGHEDAGESRAAVLNVLRSISGPFAFVFLDRVHGHLYFGRDRLGRRSLLHRSDEGGGLQLSSVADDTSSGWLEVEADAVYSISLDGKIRPEQNGGESPNPLNSSLASINKHPWVEVNVVSLVSTGVFNKTVPTGDLVLDAQTSSVSMLHEYLSGSLKLRILNVPLHRSEQTSTTPVRIAVLFSGGLDCTVLARMAHDIIPPDQEIDLINVAFENPRVVKAASKATLQKIQANGRPSLENDQQSQGRSSIDYSPYEACPDRETGRKSFKELQDVCSGRTWRFVTVNIPYKETIEHRERVIQLIHPHNTEMDLSIAYALYFAARGVGDASTNSHPDPTPYKTPARILLSGLGADELFGGYTRHATAYSRTGFPGLLDELKLDIDRLGKRNLGRDDRVISYWAKEARFPYLDENLVRWAVECPVWQKCGFGSNEQASHETPALEPGKKVLRLLAYKLGMQFVATEKKRAIQFGARTAKMEVGSTKGTTLLS